MVKVLVMGAGGIGRSAARHLVGGGHEVVLASRSGGARVPGARPLPVDATDAAATRAAAEGMDVVVNAMNPRSYHHWERDWPPIATSVQAAAEAVGARLLIVGNLYAYGRVDEVMTENTPLRPNGRKGEVRKHMWEDALEAHRAGRLRAAEVRASDYFGPGAGEGTSYLNQYVVRPAVSGRRVRVMLGEPETAHSWTYVDDIGRVVAAVAASDEDDVWGRAWHVPTAPPRSQREVAEHAARLAGLDVPEVRSLPGWLRTALRVIPAVRSLDETKHQFERPFLLDSSDAERRFGLSPTPMDEALGATVVAVMATTAAARAPQPSGERR